MVLQYYCVEIFKFSYLEYLLDEGMAFVEYFIRYLRAGHVARMGEEKGEYRVLGGNRRERDHWGDLGVDGCIILVGISRRWDVGMWTGLGWPRIGTGSGRL